MYLFFDTETTGLPLNWKAPTSDTDNWPRLVQIAWLKYDKNNNIIDRQSHVIKPDGFDIPQSSTDIHGITQERAEKEGISLDDALKMFSDAVKNSETIIAHNISFDEKIIGAEFFRINGLDPLEEKYKLCTKEVSTDFCKIPGRRGYKWPTLSELYFRLFREPFIDAHDALKDVTACAKCFFKLKKLGVIKEEK